MTRDLLRSDLIGVASTAFSTGIALMAAVSYLIRGNELGLAYVVAAVMFAVAAGFIGKRSLKRMDPVT